VERATGIPKEYTELAASFAVPSALGKLGEAFRAVKPAATRPAPFDATLSREQSPTVIPAQAKLPAEARQAVRWAMQAAKSDGLTAQQIEAKFSELGPQGFLSEYGPNLRGLAGATASQPGAGKADIFGAIERRAAGTRDRIENAVTEALGPRQNIATLTRAGIEARNEAADPLYEAWRTVKVFPTDEIKALVPILEKDGLFAAARHLMMLEEKPTNVDFFTGGDRKTWPTPEAYDYVKQAIDGRISEALDRGNRNVARIYGKLKKRLDEAISNSNPDAANVWKQAREAWANPTAIMRAREEGQAVWNPKVRRDDLLYQLTDYTAPERAAFKGEGARDSLAEMIDRSTRGDTNVRNMLLAPVNQEKLFYLADNKKTKVADILQKIEREMTFAETRQRVLQGSETEPRRAMGEMIKPNPEDTFVGRARGLDIRKPLSILPKSIENFAARRQAARYESARNVLAPILMKQGPEARDFLLMLTQLPQSLPRRIGAPLQDFSRSIDAARSNPTPRNIARLTIASRNLSNNLSGVGIDVPSTDLLRSLQGPVPGRTDQENP